MSEDDDGSFFIARNSTVLVSGPIASWSVDRDLAIGKYSSGQKFIFDTSTNQLSGQAVSGWEIEELD
jgi:hypothetical protein